MERKCLVERERRGGGGVENETNSRGGGGERNRQGEEQGQDGKMKDEGWLSHKLPKALLLTVFLSEDERTLLRLKERKREEKRVRDELNREIVEKETKKKKEMSSAQKTSYGECLAFIS